MNKFRRSSGSTKKADLTEEEKAIAEAGADTPATPAAVPPATKRGRTKVVTSDFGTPLTEEERDLLDEVAEIADQSCRKMARKLLVNAMRDYIAENKDY